VWGDFARDMPQGLPQAGDQGSGSNADLGTHLLGRRDILAAGGRADSRERRTTRKGCKMRCAAFWKPAATSPKTGRWSAWWKWAIGPPGTTVLADLYNQMKATAVHTDLDDLWRRLGVQVKNGAVTFDDGAPLAEIRKAITAKQARGPPSSNSLTRRTRQAA
jgi:hypothetical protein